MHKIMTSLAVAGAFALTAGYATDADANHLEACGGVFFEALAEGSCEVLTTEQCTTQCEPVATQKVCASRLFHECEGSCSLEASVECHAGCEETCVVDCETVAADQPPNCMGLCMSDCQMDATAMCEGDSDHGACRASAAQCCSEHCHAECDAEAETTCEPLCETACWGACDGGANLSCQIDCQAQQFTQCETTVVEECNQQCETNGLAIFCEGQFLATGGDLRACADELAEKFSIELDIDIDVDIDPDVDPDDADDELDEVDDISLSCGCTEGGPTHRNAVAFGVLMLGLGAWRIRRAARS
jgi:hypothetical protein